LSTASHPPLGLYKEPSRTSVPHFVYIRDYVIASYLKILKFEETSDTATPTDATRAGPLPANVTRDAEEKQVVGIDYNCCEGHPWRNTSKLPFVQFIIAYINVPTDRGAASPSDARPDSVPTEVLDGDTGVTSPSNAQPDPVPTEELDDATGPALAIPPVGPDAPAAGDVVSVPLAKFEQLVELLAEAVRESKLARQVQPDLERGNTDIVRKPNRTNRCHSHCNFPHDQYFGEEEKAHLQEAVDNLWNSAKPWDMACHLEAPGEPYRKPTSHASDRRYINACNRISGSRIMSYQTHWESEIDAVFARKISKFAGYYSSFRYGTRNQELDTDAILSSCIACILSCDKATLGDLLLNCYRTEALKRPAILHTDYFNDILAVVGVLMINDEHSILDESEYYWSMKYYLEIRPVNTVLGIEIASLFQITHLLFSKPLVLDGSNDSTFAINDLNIKDLESIGGLSIRWTDVFEDHLLLDMVEKTLFIAWFFTDLVSYSAMDTSKQRQV
jgi:hypothetical protein